MTIKAEKDERIRKKIQRALLFNILLQQRMETLESELFGNNPLMTNTINTLNNPPLGKGYMFWNPEEIDRSTNLDWTKLAAAIRDVSIVSNIKGV